MLTASSLSVAEVLSLQTVTCHCSAVQLSQGAVMHCIPQCTQCSPQAGSPLIPFHASCLGPHSWKLTQPSPYMHHNRPISASIPAGAHSCPANLTITEHSAPGFADLCVLSLKLHPCSSEHTTQRCIVEPRPSRILFQLAISLSLNPMISSQSQ